MAEQKEFPPERIWIDWPKKQADDAWYWTHGDYGKVEYARVEPAEDERVKEAQSFLQCWDGAVVDRDYAKRIIRNLLSLLPAQPAPLGMDTSWPLKDVLNTLATAEVVNATANLTIEEAARAVYRKYGTNLQAFWRDAFAAQATEAQDERE